MRSVADAFSSSQAAWGDVQNAMTHHWSKSKSSSKPVGKTVGKSPKGASWCWAEHAQVNLALHYETATLLQRCDDRHGTLAEAQAACEAARPWCGGVTRDSGMDCARGGKRRQYELRLADKVDAPASVSVTSWLLHRTAKNSTRCEGGSTGGARRAARALRAPTLLHADDRLGHVLRAKLEIAQHRVARGPPAFERFPEQAYRYRDWGAQTRHGRGDMYPLYTLDTLRNLADFLFDSSTGYDSAPERARRVPACALLYSTLRPTTKFINMVHSHIKVPYLLMTDTADEPITAYHGVKQLLASNTLRHWWAVDNEVLDHPKLEGLPLGVMDALELGAAADPRSVAFHANVSKYLSTLIESEQQTKGRWLMMQMTETHPERRRVRSSIVPDKWGDEEVRLTPERRGKMGVYDYLMELGQHRFVLSPRGNGLDAHRTWEALLVGCIPIVRSSALNPLYEGLPVLVVPDWSHVTPNLLRSFLVNYTVRKPLYRYEKLFADYWVGQFGVQRERCLAEERARHAPQYVYDYKQRGGWVAVDGSGRKKPTPVWTRDAVKGG